MKKILAIVAVLVLVLILGVVGLIFFGLSQLDNIAKEAIERGGTYALGVDTTVESVEIGLTSGSFDMTGFKVANPTGYDAKDRFLGLGSTSVRADLQSFQSDIITVPMFNLDDGQINLLKKDGKANYEVILDNLKKFESGDKAEPKPESETEGPGFIVNEIRMTNLGVHAALAPIGGDLTAVDFTLDEVVLTDVGKDKPVKMGELMNIIVKALLSAVANKAGDLPGGMGAELLDGLANLDSLSEMGVGVAAEGAAIIGDLGEEATKAGEKAVEDATKAVEDAANEAVEDLSKGINDLLGGGGNN